LAESVGGGLFGRLGLPTDRGFLAETIDRISRGLLPEPLDEQDLCSSSVGCFRMLRRCARS
jgi:hypothetical protein